MCTSDGTKKKSQRIWPGEHIFIEHGGRRSGAASPAPSPKASRIPAKALRSRLHPWGGRWDPHGPGRAEVQPVRQKRSVTLLPALLSALAWGRVLVAAPKGLAAG